MNINFKPVRYTARLPATPCTIDMRQAICSLAKSQGITVAQLQRNIIQLFLAEYVSKANKEYSKADTQSVERMVD